MRPPRPRATAPPRRPAAPGRCDGAGRHSPDRTPPTLRRRPDPPASRRHPGTAPSTRGRLARGCFECGPSLSGPSTADPSPETPRLSPGEVRLRRVERASRRFTPTRERRPEGDGVVNGGGSADQEGDEEGEEHGEPGTQLLERAAHQRLDRLDRDPQPLGDLAVRQTLLAVEEEDLPRTFGELADRLVERLAELLARRHVVRRGRDRPHHRLRDRALGVTLPNPTIPQVVERPVPSRDEEEETHALPPRPPGGIPPDRQEEVLDDVLRRLVRARVAVHERAQLRVVVSEDPLQPRRVGARDSRGRTRGEADVSHRVPATDTPRRRRVDAPTPHRTAAASELEWANIASYIDRTPWECKGRRRGPRASAGRPRPGVRAGPPL